MKLNRIKTVLSEKGISQTWLAKQLDKSFSMVNAYACNRIQPNLETLQRIADYNKLFNTVRRFWFLL
ncbi:MAG: helix-turn-helix transcriptional regulator [Phocaeicola dorei]|nr:helix-turn-helix transcriptional regulator [Phocaeicola dorei]